MVSSCASSNSSAQKYDVKMRFNTLVFINIVLYLLVINENKIINQNDHFCSDNSFVIRWRDDKKLQKK
jgi:hypothetical protein